jgi:phage terminase small subunit
MANKKINPRYLDFIDIYLTNGLNGTEAYMSVYPKSSRSASKRNASRLLSREEVQEEIKRRQEEEREKYNITREWVINEYMDLIKSCKEEGLDGTGILKDRANWNKAIAEIRKLLALDEQVINKIEISQNKEQPLFPDVNYDI